MSLLFTTVDRARRAAVQADPTLNGIDTVEIIPRSDGSPSAVGAVMLVRFFRPIPALAADNVRIAGMIGPTIGDELTPLWVTPASPLSEPADPLFTDAERIRYASLPDAASVLVVVMGPMGDLPAARLSIVTSQPDPTPPTGFDPPLSSIDLALEYLPSSRAAYRCGDEDRRQRTADSTHLNGIDFLEVMDRESPTPQSRQTVLFVRCLKPVAGISADNISITGGVRITPVRAVWAFPADAVPAVNTIASPAERSFFAALPEPERVLVVRTDATGDFSTYTLAIVQSLENLSPLLGFDPQLAVVRFSFKVECPNDFDCAQPPACPPPTHTEPHIDYLAKDYTSFRRLMLDQLATIMPAWTDRSPADVQVALVELLAYVGDHLSYYQDAVATEAYLGTARRRVSVRRHARLLDYFMHDGCNARAWICFTLTDPPGAAEGMPIPAGTPLLSRSDGGDLVFSSQAGIPIDEPLVFETMEDITLRLSRSTILFHTWSDGDCTIPCGSVRATLVRENGLELAAGDLLIFEETADPKRGNKADADRTHRHAVRLISAIPTHDPLDGTPIMEIEWDRGDALPFDFRVSSRTETGLVLNDIGVARGNVVMADHGRSVSQTLVADDVPGGRDFRYRLNEGPVTFRRKMDRHAPASAASEYDSRMAEPAIEIVQGDLIWKPQPDLLGSDRFAPEFVVEIESDGTSYVRFGDGTHGKIPEEGTPLIAKYRIGVGRDGNVGAEAINSLTSPVEGIERIWNPLPAIGGCEPESIEQVRQYAPNAFRSQERAVTEADYAELAERHPDVQKAAAVFRWTGSWYTAFVTVDRFGGKPVDARFKEEMARYLEKFRIVGYDLEISAPVFVPLDIRLRICVRPGYFRSDVKQELLRVFGSGMIEGGRRGFFHPDNFTFGQSLHLSRIYRAALDVPGVDTVDVVRFQRWGVSADGEIAAGALVPGQLEVVRLDNDPSFPENGKIEFEMGGGL